MTSRLSSFGSLLLLFLSTAGCTELTNAFVAGGPSPIAFNQGTFVNVDPQTVAPFPVTGATCATGASFVAPFTLIVGPVGPVNVTVVDVRLEFMDIQGLQLPPTVVNSGDLERQFGQLTVPRFTSRNFDLRFESGCTARSTGMLTVFVTTTDGTSMRSSVARLHVQ